MKELEKQSFEKLDRHTTQSSNLAIRSQPKSPESYSPNGEGTFLFHVVYDKFSSDKSFVNVMRAQNQREIL